MLNLNYQFVFYGHRLIKGLSFFSAIDDLEYVSTCLSAEKALSAVADVIGIVKTGEATGGQQVRFP